MDEYKSEPRIFSAIFLGSIAYLIYHYFDGYLSIAFALLFVVAGGLCLLPLKMVGFSKDQIRIDESWTIFDLFEKSDVLDVSITNKKIYVQTKNKNFTINKSDFGSEKFDIIVNQFLKVKAENNLAK